MSVALLVSAITFATIEPTMRPSPRHLTWMIVLPVALGIAFNRGATRWITASVLIIVGLIATTIVGNMMGGI